eukprot:2032835-Rhodomonas_salina.3
MVMRRLGDTLSGPAARTGCAQRAVASPYTSPQQHTIVSAALTSAARPGRRVQEHGGARGGEDGAAEAGGPGADPDQREHRGADGQGQRPAAVVHLAAEARRVRAARGHGLHHAERRPLVPRAVRDRAAPRLGVPHPQVPQPLQDDRQAHVGQHDPPPPGPNRCPIPGSGTRNTRPEARTAKTESLLSFVR